jgi:UDP-N-acetylglucosamine--N-acetylmuramyl-(pentapeptide) pyrophosphoryl-undecaprenol N-acetylglucosamine transferase
MVHTLVLAGGGTGGHVYPAIAMGEAMRDRGHRVLYYGDAARLEGRVAPDRGFSFSAVPAVQFPRAGLLAKARFARSLLAATWTARGLLKRDAATMVLGVGGYVMAPTVLAAWTLGIPAALHESNVAPGMANRLCARVARLVLLAYAETSQRLPGRAEQQVVGCPVNPKILAGDGARYGLPAGRPVVLVVGGSLGAATINAIGRALAAVGTRDFSVLHVTGPRYFEEVTAGYGALPSGVKIVGYEDRMGDAYALADLVVCRAGSSTLAELCAVGKPSVLVPSPNVTDNHQEANARGLERAGAAVVLLEKGLDPATAAGEIAALLSDPARLRAMGDVARRLARIDSAAEVATLLEDRLGRG